MTWGMEDEIVSIGEEVDSVVGVIVDGLLTFDHGEVAGDEVAEDKVAEDEVAGKELLMSQHVLLVFFYTESIYSWIFATLDGRPLLADVDLQHYDSEFQHNMRQDRSSCKHMHPNLDRIHC